MFLIGDTQRSSSSTPLIMRRGIGRQDAGAASGNSSSANIPQVITWRVVSSPPMRISKDSCTTDSSSSRSPSISACTSVLTRSSVGLGRAIGDHAELELAKGDAGLHRLQLHFGRRRARGAADEVVGPPQQIVVAPTAGIRACRR